MQTVQPKFHQLAQGDVVPIDYRVSISFDKSYDDSVEFFQLNVSQLNGMDVLGTNEGNPLQQWDKYAYASYTDRVVDISYERQIDFPYSVHSAIADVTLDNYDGMFTPNAGSPLDPYLIPKRPVRISAGYQTATVVPQVVGLTQSSPVADDATRTASFTVMDFLSEIFDLPLNETIAMRDVYTGTVIETILQQYGILPSQYVTARGRNKIPFLFFEKRGVKAGEVLRELMQAEMGDLWLTEDGIIRFEPRLTQPDTPVMTFDSNNILEITSTGDDEIINKVIIHSDLREVQEFQSVYSKSASGSVDTNLVIPAASTKVIEVNLQDPTYSFVNPTQGHATNVSWFIATTAAGATVSGGVSVISSELRTNSISLEFYNANNFSVYIEEMDIWGEPAKKYDEIDYELKDDNSIAIYGERVLEIDNNFFGSYDNCRSFAYTVLDSYANYANIINMQVKGDVALQLGDVVTVDYENFSHDYKVIGISHRLPEEFTIKARRYDPRQWFTLDASQLNGTHVLAP